MVELRRGLTGSTTRHRCAGSRRPCLYNVALREAIATQHGLADAGRTDLDACESCGTPYLLLEVWQPLSEEGELACPRCGAFIASWEGARTYVAYWYRDGQDHGAR